jgi:hypothetical protein
MTASKTASLLPPDQDQGDRQEVREDNFIPCQVSAGREKLYVLPVQGSETQYYSKAVEVWALSGYLGLRMRFAAPAVLGSLRAKEGGSQASELLWKWKK